MPELTLEVVSIDSTPLPERHCQFSGLGGTIGRDAGNTLVLQDKHRRVSRLHASITFPQGYPVITNASTSLPILVGTTVLNYGQKIKLAADNLIEIGPFVLKVSDPKRNQVEDALLSHVQPTILAAPLSRPPKAISSAQPLALASIPTPASTPPSVTDPDPFEDLFAGMSPVAPNPTPVAAVMETDPFADLLGLGNSAGQVLSPGADSNKDPFPSYLQRVEPSFETPVQGGASPERAAAAIIPDDFNPFELPSQTSRNSADPLAQMLEGDAQATASIDANETSIDALFAPAGGTPFEGLTGMGASQPLLPAQGLNALAVPPEASDPLLMFGEPAQSADISMYSPVRDDLAEIGGAYQPPRAFFPDTSPSFQNQNHNHLQPVMETSVSSDALTSAFLKGAGIPASALPGGLTPEVMAVIGGLLTTATAGAIDMLAARAATKLEVQASVTIISAQSNNPLKFLPNAESALQQMLGKKMPGFMRPDEAMRDAFDDLRAHEIGVIAGTRAALTEVLGRFDPCVLEKRLAAGSLIDSILPSFRKTKLWEIYLEQYARIRREAEDDFQSVFGRSFLAAYEHETARVKEHTTEAGKK